MKNTLVRLLAIMALAVGACAGEDGAPGTPGIDGQNGTDGTDGTNGTDGVNGSDGVDAGATVKATVESCAICHSSGRSADVAGAHAKTGIAVATAPVVAVGAEDVTLTFNVTVDGAPSSAFVIQSLYRHYYDGTKTVSGTTPVDPGNEFVRQSFTAATAAQIADWTTAPNGAFKVAVTNGQYVVTIKTFADEIATGNHTFMARMHDGPTPAEYVLAKHFVSPLVGYPALARSVASDDACKKCHGETVFWKHGEHHEANPVGVSACTVCHTRFDSAGRGVGGMRLTAYVHGIHNSHNMKGGRVITQTGAIDPDGSSGPIAPVAGPHTATTTEGVYARNDSLKFANYPTDMTVVPSSPWSVGFPSDMKNCSNCHQGAQLDTVLAAPVTFATCTSCHDGWEGFANIAAATAGPLFTHKSYTAATNCAGCHNATPSAAFDTLGEAHGRGLTLSTPRDGLIWNGKDAAVDEGKRIVMTITGVSNDATVTPAQLVVTWTATLDGVAVDPCNDDATVGPLFFKAQKAVTPALVGWESGHGNQAASNMSLLRAYAQGDDFILGVGTSPGQPGGAVNLSTTNTTCVGVVATTKVNADTIPAGVTKGIVALQGKVRVKHTGINKIIQVRSPSPTREFNVADGALPAQLRRAIVDFNKCNACHEGLIYQHGGNRIDNTTLCGMCHNAASNEKNNRATMGVTTAEAYDGKAGQTYDLRTMIHAIHSAGETGASLVYYRSNGIYVFGSEAAIAATPNWPGAGSKAVYGSDTALDGTAKTPDMKTHNEIVVHYPRPLNDCGACHTGGSENVIPDPLKAMAVTVDAGGAPWTNKIDDVLMGPVTASCMTCHQSGVKTEQTMLRSHAYANGWAPVNFAGGRQDLIDVAQ